jgi:hypothetical protein
VFLQAGSAAGSPFFFFTLPAKINDPCVDQVLTGPTGGVFEYFKKLDKALIFKESASFQVKASLSPGGLCFNRCLQRGLSREHGLFLAFPPFALPFVLRGLRLLFSPEFLQPFRQGLQLFVHKIIDAP